MIGKKENLEEGQLIPGTDEVYILLLNRKQWKAAA